MIPENGTALPADTLYSLEPAFEVVPETKRVKLLSLARGYHDLEKDFVKEQFYSR